MNSTSNNLTRAGGFTSRCVLLLALAALVIFCAPQAVTARDDRDDKQSADGGGRDGQAPKDGEAAKQRDGRGGDGDDRGERRDGRRDGRRGKPPFEFGWGHHDDDDLRSPTPAEWGEVSGFMQRYSPRRLQAVEELPDGQWKDKLRKVMFARYRGLRGIEKRDRDAFKQRGEQLLVEDQIFGVVSDWAGSDDTERPKLKEALKENVGKLVDLDLRERKRRVERLEAELREQRAALEKDTKERDALVDDRYGRFLDWANRWAEKRRGEKKRDED